MEIKNKLLNHLTLSGKKETGEKNLIKSVKKLQKNSFKNSKKIFQLALINSTPIFKLHKITPEDTIIPLILQDKGDIFYYSTLSEIFESRSDHPSSSSKPCMTILCKPIWLLTAIKAISESVCFMNLETIFDSTGMPPSSH